MKSGIYFGILFIMALFVSCGKAESESINDLPEVNKDGDLQLVETIKENTNDMAKDDVISSDDFTSMDEKNPDIQEKKTTVTVNNPILWADVPDVDVIRVDDYYYMVSTTMHLSPGAPIMRSTDLANWEIISYVFDQLSDHESYNLWNGKSVYGKGQWATSLRYHEGVFYACFASLDKSTTYIYYSDDPTISSWNRTVLSGWHHDPSLLFDDDGKAYLVYGGGEIRIKELKSDLTGFMPGGVDQLLIDVRKPNNILNGEGSHFYKINGKYYLFTIEWTKTGSGRRIQQCYRSDTLLGEYEEKTVLDDNFYYGNNGVAQGGIFDTPEGDWYGMVFQDHGAVGRIPMLVPVTWVDGWPIMGVDGKVPVTTEVMGTSKIQTNIVESDDFDYKENKLKLQWQWNHNPDNSLWSVTERPGYLRLKTGNIVSNILQARNSLSQRTMGPISIYDTKLETAGMQAGDYAGISAFQSNYGMLGVKVDESGNKYLMLASNDGNGNPKEQGVLPLEKDTVYLRITFFFNTGDIKRLTMMDKAYFYYSYDGVAWEKFDYTLPMQYTLDHFMGYRATLYYYSTSNPGGYADFDYYYFKNSLN